MRLHADETDFDISTVRCLLAEQFPTLAGLSLTELRGLGTVNRIFRIGDDVSARLPRVRAWEDGISREWNSLRRLGPELSLATPEPLALGRPGCEYPFVWALHRWIEGSTYSDSAVSDEQKAARDLAGFMQALHAVPGGAEALPAGRRPLAELDAATRRAIGDAGDLVDRDAVERAWRYALTAPEFDGTATWIHCDLLRPNLLVRDGRLAAVLDFGGAGVGDPANDLTAAWHVFGPVGRSEFRSATGADAGTWQRARGFALHQALLAIPYYVDSNPGLTAQMLRSVAQILLDET